MGDTRGKRKVHVVYDSAGEVVAVMRSNRLPEAVKAAKRAGGKVDTLRLDEEQPTTYRAEIAPVLDAIKYAPIHIPVYNTSSVISSTNKLVLSAAMKQARDAMALDLNAMLFSGYAGDSQPGHR